MAARPGPSAGDLQGATSAVLLNLGDSLIRVHSLLGRSGLRLAPIGSRGGAKRNPGLERMLCRIGRASKPLRRARYGFRHKAASSSLPLLCRVFPAARNVRSAYAIGLRRKLVRKLRSVAASRHADAQSFHVLRQLINCRSLLVARRRHNPSTNARESHTSLLISREKISGHDSGEVPPRAINAR